MGECAVTEVTEPRWEGLEGQRRRDIYGGLSQASQSSFSDLRGSNWTVGVSPTFMYVGAPLGAKFRDWGTHNSPGSQPFEPQMAESKVQFIFLLRRKRCLLVPHHGTLRDGRPQMVLVFQNQDGITLACGPVYFDLFHSKCILSAA